MNKFFTIAICLIGLNIPSSLAQKLYWKLSDTLKSNPRKVISIPKNGQFHYGSGWKYVTTYKDGLPVRQINYQNGKILLARDFTYDAKKRRLSEKYIPYVNDKITELFNFSYTDDELGRTSVEKHLTAGKTIWIIDSIVYNHNGKRLSSVQTYPDSTAMGKATKIRYT